MFVMASLSQDTLKVLPSAKHLGHLSDSEDVLDASHWTCKVYWGTACSLLALQVKAASDV